MLDHPYVIRLHDAATIPAEVALASEGRWNAATPYVVLDFAEGGSAAKRPPRAWPALRRALTCLLHALAHAHALGLLHRDIKPANLLIDRSRGTWRLADFGLATSWEDQLPGRAGGTRSFIAPEQAENARWALGPWTDLYSAGRVAWALACHVLPTPHQPLPPFAPRYEVPRGLEAWIRELAAQAPDARFTSAADALWALEHLDAPRPHAGLRPAERWMEPAPDPRPRPATSLGLLATRPAPFVGRGLERDQLWDALRATVGNPGARAVLVEAEPGLGASRLTEWIGRHASQMGVAQWVRASHDPRRGPGHGLAAGLARALGTVGLSREDQLRRLALRLPGTDPERLDRFARLLDASADDALAEDRQDRVLELIRAWAGVRPLVIGLDDLQWGPESAAIALRLLHEGMDVRALVLATVTRSPEPPMSPGASTAIERLRRHRRAQRVELPALDEAELTSVATGLLPLDPEDAAELARRAQGRPGDLMTHLRALGAAGLLRASPSGLRASFGEPAPAAAPDDAPLTAPTARVAGLTACLGPSFDRDWLSAVAARLGWEDPSEALESLRAAGWLRADAGPEREAFSSEGARQRALAALSPEEVRDLHAAIAASIPADATGPAELERRGRHLLASGAPEGVGHLLAAARARLAHGEPRLALAIVQDVRRVPELDPKARVEAEQIDAFARTRLVDALDAPTLSEADLRLALAAARAQGDEALAARAHLGRAQLAAARGRTQEARHHLDLAHRSAGAQAPGLRGRLSALAGRLALEAGDLPGALSALDEAIPLVRAVGDAPTLAEATRQRATALRWADKGDAAVDAARLALACAQAAGLETGPACVDLALAALFDRQHATALSALAKADHPGDRAPHAAMVAAAVAGDHRDARDALDALSTLPTDDPDFDRAWDRARANLLARDWVDLVARLESLRSRGESSS